MLGAHSYVSVGVAHSYVSVGVAHSYVSVGMASSHHRLVMLCSSRWHLSPEKVKDRLALLVLRLLCIVTWIANAARMQHELWFSKANRHIYQP